MHGHALVEGNEAQPEPTSRGPVDQVEEGARLYLHVFDDPAHAAGGVDDEDHVHITTRGDRWLSMPIGGRARSRCRHHLRDRAEQHHHNARD